MKYFAVLLVLLAPRLGWSQALDTTSVRGWQGITLGSDVRQMGGFMQHRGRVQGREIYQRASDTALCRQLGIERIRYFFYLQQLHSFEIQTTPAQSKALLVRLQEAFGPGEQVGYAPRYYWRFRQLHIHYDENLFTHRAVVTFESPQVQAAQEKAWWER